MRDRGIHRENTEQETQYTVRGRNRGREKKRRQWERETIKCAEGEAQNGQETKRKRAKRRNRGVM
jgi:hypothetical protein